MELQLSRLEAEVLRQAAEYALDHDQGCSVFYGDHRTAVRRAIRQLDQYLRDVKEAV